MKTLAVGYGNLTRSDDGLGIRAVQELDRIAVPGTETRAAQQLHVEMAEEILAYERVVFIDAAENGPEIDFRPLRSASGGMSSSHSMAPGMILDLAQKVYGKSPQAWLCTIRGENFDFGTELSGPAQARMEKAVERILEFLREGVSHA